MSRTWWLAGLLMVSQAGVANAAPMLWGSDVGGNAMVQIDPVTGFGTPIFPLGGLIIADLAYDPNHDVLYGSTTTGNSLYRINRVSGAITLIGHYPVGITLMHGLEYDPNNNVLFGITNQSGTRALYTIDVATAATTLVGTHGIQGLSDLAFDAANNVMYASEAFDGTPHVEALRTIDLATGVTTLVGNFNGAGSTQLGVGLAYDPVQGMFATDNKASSTIDDTLYKINPATGQATLVGPIGAQNVLGLTFVIPEPGAAGLVSILLVGAFRHRRKDRLKIRMSCRSALVESARRCAWRDRVAAR